MFTKHCLVSRDSKHLQAEGGTPVSAGRLVFPCRGPVVSQKCETHVHLYMHGAASASVWDTFA